MEHNKKPIIEFRHISINNSRNEPVFEDLNFNIYKSETVFIVGHNDKERTLILYNILGQLKPAAGRIKVFNRLLSRLRSKARLLELRKLIGYVHPQQGLINNLSIKDNITLPLRFNSDLDSNTINVRFETVKTLFNLENIVSKEIWDIDNISIKKILFARAVINNPHLLLIDEPTTYIEKRDVEQILALLDIALKKELVSDDCSIIITSEDKKFAKERADKIMYLKDGRINYWGDASLFADV